MIPLSTPNRARAERFAQLVAAHVHIAHIGDEYHVFVDACDFDSLYAQLDREEVR